MKKKCLENTNLIPVKVDDYVKHPSQKKRSKKEFRKEWFYKYMIRKRRA